MWAPERVPKQAGGEAVWNASAALLARLLEEPAMNRAPWNKGQLKKRRMEPALQTVGTISKVFAGLHERTHVPCQNETVTNDVLAGVAQAGDFGDIEHSLIAQIDVELLDQD